MATTVISKTPADPALDQQNLYAKGLEYVEDLARRFWTDYNIHDPGVTTLELLCYALTDLSYRASRPIQDLLATDTDNTANMHAQFFTARQILPNRALTVLDYRKLLIDLKGVKNAWVQPADVRYYLDIDKAILLKTNPGGPGIREVPIHGLYNVLIDFMEDVTTDPARSQVMTSVQQKLQANRNLCEDFVKFDTVATQQFIVCAEIELEPDADVAQVNAEVLFGVEQYLAPSVPNYSLSEMLGRQKPDGTGYTVDEIFDGPVLDCGFIDDNELIEADLRQELYLSDVIRILMDIDGVLAVRDCVVNPDNLTTPLANKWTVPVESGKKPELNPDKSRLVFYKRNVPIVPDGTKVKAQYNALVAEERAKTETTNADDIPIPEGTFRNPEEYYSFQNHFPAIYGIGPNGLSGTATKQRQALAYQLKAYLLFFDQLLADYLTQLAHVKDLFSTDETLQKTYFYKVVQSFLNFQSIYAVEAKDLENDIRAQVEEPDPALNRRNRFLDHLIARFAEQFSQYVSIMYTIFGAGPDSALQVKCRFLKDYPAISSERGLAYNYTLQGTGDLWNTNNTSGLERRLGRLLGITDVSRRDLSTIDTANFKEGFYVIENILLRPNETDTSMLPVCADPNCTDCPDDDPYSYRIHVMLPAYAGRFQNMDFRRFTEEVIRQETPAHILPMVCWISKDDMVKLEKAYHDWIVLQAGVSATDRQAKIDALIAALTGSKNVYPSQNLIDCSEGESQAKFILGRTALGSIQKPQS
jgi:hypothetical protein